MEARWTGIGNRIRSMWSDDELRTFTRAEAGTFREQGPALRSGFLTLTALLSLAWQASRWRANAGSFVPLWGARSRGGCWFHRCRSQWLPAAVRRQLANLGTNHVAPLQRLQPDCASWASRESRGFCAAAAGRRDDCDGIPEVLGVTAADLDAWRPTRLGYRPLDTAQGGRPDLR